MVLFQTGLVDSGKGLVRREFGPTMTSTYDDGKILSMTGRLSPDKILTSNRSTTSMMNKYADYLSISIAVRGYLLAISGSLRSLIGISKM